MSADAPKFSAQTVRRGNRKIVLCECGHESDGDYFGRVDSQHRAAELLDAWVLHRQHLERAHLGQTRDAY